eukprot:1022212-Amphidinium_carterae.1
MQLASRYASLFLQVEAVACLPHLVARWLCCTRWREQCGLAICTCSEVGAGVCPMSVAMTLNVDWICEAAP